MTPERPGKGSRLWLVLEYLGLVGVPGEQARKGASRFWTGSTVSPRLDEEVDALRRRVEELERRG